MTTETDKPIPAAYLRSEEFARQKQAQRQKRYERLQRRHERVATRLASVLSDETKEVRMDDTHPERIYVKEQHMEKLFALTDALRNGTNGAQYAFSNQLAIWYPATKDRTYRLKYVERDPGFPDILQPYLEPVNPDDKEELAGRKAQLTQELAQVEVKLKVLTIDELKSKLLTLMDPGQVITVTKVDPTAPDAGLRLVKEEPPVEAKPESATEAPAAEQPVPESAPAQ